MSSRTFENVAPSENWSASATKICFVSPKMLSFELNANLRLSFILELCVAVKLPPLAFMGSFVPPKITLKGSLSSFLPGNFCFKRATICSKPCSFVAKISVFCFDSVACLTIACAFGLTLSGFSKSVSCVLLGFKTPHPLCSHKEDVSSFSAFLILALSGWIASLSILMFFNVASVAFCFGYVSSLSSLFDTIALFIRPGSTTPGFSISTLSVCLLTLGAVDTTILDFFSFMNALLLMTRYFTLGFVGS